VVLTSVSHLAGVGTVEYIDQFTVARGRLLGEFQGGLEVVHGFPVLLSGMSDRPGIRALIDSTDWFASVPVNTNRFLTDTLQHFRSVVGNCGSAAGSPAASALTTGSAAPPDNGSGSPAAPDQLRFLLPKDLSGKTKQIYLSCPDTVPIAIPPIDSDTESELLTCLITELNSKFLADLAPLARDNSGTAGTSDSEEEAIDHASVHKNTRFIIIGGSHAARIASALDDLNLEVTDLSSPGWSVTDANVQCATALLLEELELNKQMKTIIIYQLLDNSSYYGTRSDGLRHSPIKDQGRYHILGDLQLADRDLVKQMTTTFTPLLRAGGEHEKIILVPLMRYVSSKCCGDRSHITNFKCEGWGKFIGQGVINIGTWLNDVVYLKRIRNFEIVCPNELLHRDETPKKAARRLYRYWSEDPVHMTKEGYAALAEALSDAARSLNTRRPSCGTSSSLPGSGSTTGAGTGNGTGSRSGGGTRGAANRRQSWVSADDAVAECSQQHGSYRGGRGRPWHFPAARGRGGWRGSNQKYRGRRLRLY
jgi:hypothetical protein